jgi:PTS system nitrogen regulatory IIA component
VPEAKGHGNLEEVLMSGLEQGDDDARSAEAGGAGSAPGTNLPLDAHLAVDRVHLDFRVSRAREVLAELARLLGGNDESSREAVYDDLVAREQLASTGVGGGIAFPHARVDLLPSIRIAFVRTARPVKFHALDGKRVDLYVGVAGPMPGRREYLSVLARLAYLFRSESIREEFRAVESAAETLALLKRRAASEPRTPRVEDPDGAA